MKKSLSFLALAGVAFAATSSAQAAVVVLDFESIAPTYPNGNDTFVLDYYNGGTSSSGTSGTNFGVSFSSNALVICLNDLGVSCSNASRGGLAPSSSTGGLFFLSGSSTTLNYASGFDTGFSFNYAQPNTNGGFVSVYSDLDGMGTLLGTINLTLTPSTCDAVYAAAYCPFVPVGVGFAGTAKSIVFGGVANFVVFDDITFGAVDPGVPPAVPEPASWAMMIAGLGVVGAAMRRRKAVVSFA